MTKTVLAAASTIARNNLHEQLRSRVHIVDSLTCSISEGLLVRVATQMRDEGKTAETIAAELERQRDKVHIVAFVDTLDYLSKGGRMPKALSAAATLLSIHPVIGTIDGKVALLGPAHAGKDDGHPVAWREARGFFPKQSDSTSPFQDERSAPMQRTPQIHLHNSF